MADWTDDKDLGPWDFTEQPDKWGYLNNPRWSNQADAIVFCQKHGLPLDLTDQHLPCGHWHKQYIPEPTRESVVTGKWVAAMQKPGTPYIYLYDIAYKAVIKLDTSVNPVILAEVLPINATYDLDHHSNSTQRGGYCMNKDGTRIWYLFRQEGTRFPGYPASGPKNDCELIEVDISGSTMVKVGSTIYPDLIDYSYPSTDEKINDGCSNDVHTFWSTNKLSGRIIKIRNSDHAIIDDHLFNNPNADESIRTLDTDKDNSKLYWVWVAYLGSSVFHRHLVRSDYSFNIDLDIDDSGFLIWQNMLRVMSGHVMQNRVYHPSPGHLFKRDLAFVEEAENTDQSYLRNMFGVKSNLFFLLQNNNAVSPTYCLRCLDFSDLTHVSESIPVNYYCGYTYLVHYDWDRTHVSAMNEQTGVIVIVRYHNIENRNYVACFKADSSLDLICDEPLDYVTTAVGGNEEIISDEPQIWTMPG